MRKQQREERESKTRATAVAKIRQSGAELDGGTLDVVAAERAAKDLTNPERKAILVHVLGEDAAATSKLLKPALIAQLTDKLTGFDVSALPAPVAETPAPSAAGHTSGKTMWRALREISSPGRSPRMT